MLLRDNIKLFNETDTLKNEMKKLKEINESLITKLTYFIDNLGPTPYNTSPPPSPSPSPDINSTDFSISSPVSSTNVTTSTSSTEIFSSYDTPSTITSSTYNLHSSLHVASSSIATSSLATQTPFSPNFVSAITYPSVTSTYSNKSPLPASCVTSSDSQSKTCLYSNTTPPFDISAPYICPSNLFSTNFPTSPNSIPTNRSSVLSPDSSPLANTSSYGSTPASNTLIPSTDLSHLPINVAPNTFSNYSSHSSLEATVPPLNTIYTSVSSFCPTSLTGSSCPLNVINPSCPPLSVLTSPMPDEPLYIDIPSPNLYNNKFTCPNFSNSASENFVISDQYIFPLPPPVAFRSLAFIAPPEHKSQASPAILTPTTHDTTKATKATPCYTTNNPHPNISTKSVSYNNPGDQSDTEQVNSMHKKNIHTTNAATAAAIVAFKNGATELQAMLIGNDAAKKARKTYSQKLASKSTSNINIKNNDKNNGASIKQLPNQIGTNQNAAHSTSSQQYMAAPYNMSSSDTLQNPVKQNTKYLRGTASTPNRNLAGEIPEHFKNKVIVISPVSKELNQNQIKEEINRIAGKVINYKSDLILLNKTCQNSRTIAFELNDDDFMLLSNRSLWNSNMLISEFTGRRFWRQNKIKLTNTERKNAKRDSWNY